MTYHQKVAAMTLVGVAAAVAFGLGFSTGVRVEGREQQAAADARDRVERQIVDLIVQRNPQATIREFAGFPEHLIAESAKYRIDFRLALALIDHESAFDPTARGSRGEVGLMQVMPATGEAEAKRLGAEWVAPNKVGLGTLGDPKANVTIGLAYLARMRDAFGEMGPAALRAYNRGPARAREVWPEDRYAERVAMRFVRVAHEVAVAQP